MKSFDKDFEVLNFHFYSAWHSLFFAFPCNFNCNANLRLASTQRKVKLDPPFDHYLTTI